MKTFKSFQHKHKTTFNGLATRPCGSAFNQIKKINHSKGSRWVNYGRRPTPTYQLPIDLKFWSSSSVESIGVQVL
jgi:hypothetical protein